MEQPPIPSSGGRAQEDTAKIEMTPNNIKGDEMETGMVLVS